MKTMVIGNGELLDADLERIRSFDGKRIVCDGAANFLREQDISFDIIIGDFDSIEEIEAFQSIEIIKLDDQETNDLEKAISYCLEQKLEYLVVVGIFGFRLDHTLTNLSVCNRYYSQFLTFEMYHKNWSLSFLPEGKHIIGTKKNSLISFFPLRETKIYTCKGLKYSLTSKALSFGNLVSLSNQALGREVELEIQEGLLLMMLKA